MLQQEFEERIGQKISRDMYEIVEAVYVYYPAEMSKDQIAELWKIGGYRLFMDLYPTAARMMDIEEFIQKVQKQRYEIGRLLKEADEKIAYLNESKKAIIAGSLDALAAADALPDDGTEGV